MQRDKNQKRVLPDSDPTLHQCQKIFFHMGIGCLLCMLINDLKVWHLKARKAFITLTIKWWECGAHICGRNIILLCVDNGGIYSSRTLPNAAGLQSGPMSRCSWLEIGMAWAVFHFLFRSIFSYQNLTPETDGNWHSGFRSCSKDWSCRIQKCQI